MSRPTLAEVFAAEETPPTAPPKPSPWRSTTDALRRRPRVPLCLSRAVALALPALAGGIGQRGHYVEALIRRDAASRGAPIPEE